MVAMLLADASPFRLRKGLGYFLFSAGSGGAWMIAQGLAADPHSFGWLLILTGVFLLICLVGIWNAQDWACIACGMILTFLSGYNAALAIQGSPRSWLFVAGGLAIGQTFLFSGARLARIREAIGNSSASA
jgi:hypothetical protein